MQKPGTNVFSGEGSFNRCPSPLCPPGGGAAPGRALPAEEAGLVPGLHRLAVLALQAAVTPPTPLHPPRPLILPPTAARPSAGVKVRGEARGGGGGPAAPQLSHHKPTDQSRLSGQVRRNRNRAGTAGRPPAPIREALPVFCGRGRPLGVR